MERYKSAKKPEALCALCAARCSETYHHWRVFAGAADGACLGLKRSPLEELLRSLPNVRYGDVDYLMLGAVDQLTPNDIDRIPFIKRYGFAAEEEYRIIIECDKP